MIFRVVVIKELFDMKYTLDVLFFWITEEEIREILHQYKLVALEVYEYKKENVEEYSSIKVLIKFEWQEIRLLSNSQNLESFLYSMIASWFDVENINYVDNRAIDQEEIYKIIAEKKEEVNQWIKQQQDILAQQEQKNEQYFNDQKLEKVQNLTKDFLEKVPSFLESAKGELPKSELKVLYSQRQELSKWKMWSNVEKISSFLEEAYNNYNRLEQELLSFQESPNIDVEWSNITNAYLAAEVKKLEKAKSMLKLWWAKWWQDMLYANLWWIIIYFNLIKKDVLARMKDYSFDFPKFIGDILLWLIFLQVISVLYFLIFKNSANMNYYIYSMFIQFGVFWLVLYWINFIKKQNLLISILLGCWWIVVSLLVIWALKQNFIF